MNIKKNKVANIFNSELALLIFWVLVLTTLNLNSVALNEINTANYKVNLETFFILINYLGYFVPFFLILIIVYNFCIIKKKNIFTSLYILYGIWQLIVFIFVEQKISNYDNFRLIFNLIIIAVIFNVATDKNYINFYKKSLILIISFISIISIYFVFKLFYEYLSEDTMLYLYSSSTLEAETKTIHQANPRITGISRMLLILFYFIFFLKIKFKKNKPKKICLILLFFLSFTIYGMQSRGAILGLGLLILMYFFLVQKKNKREINNYIYVIYLTHNYLGGNYVL